MRSEKHCQNWGNCKKRAKKKLQNKSQPPKYSKNAWTYCLSSSSTGTVEPSGRDHTFGRPHHHEAVVPLQVLHPVVGLPLGVHQQRPAADGRAAPWGAGGGHSFKGRPGRGGGGTSTPNPCPEKIPKRRRRKILTIAGKVGGGGLDGSSTALEGEMEKRSCGSRPRPSLPPGEGFLVYPLPPPCFRGSNRLGTIPLSCSGGGGARLGTSPSPPSPTAPLAAVPHR